MINLALEIVIVGGGGVGLIIPRVLSSYLICTKT